MSSNCNLPTLQVPTPAIDYLAVLLALFEALGIPIPPLPNVPLPPTIPCPLDEL